MKAGTGGRVVALLAGLAGGLVIALLLGGLPTPALAGVAAAAVASALAIALVGPMPAEPTDAALAALKLPATPEGVLRLISEMPAPFILLDRDLRHIAVTDRHLKQHGLPPRERFIGRHHYEIFDKIDERWKEMHRRALAGETFSTDKEWWIRPDGRGEWLLWELKPWHDRDGEIGGIAIYGEVISPIVEAERRAEAAIEHLTSFYSLIPHGLWSADASGALLEVSQNFLDQTGLSLPAMRAEWCNGLGFVHPDDRPALADAVHRGISAGRACDLEQRFRVANGTYRWFRTRCVPQRRSDGAIERWIGMFEDIHDKKLAELELHEAEQRLRQAQRTEAIGQLSGGIAHDFNNLLGVLGGNLGLLAEELTDRPELHGYALTGLRAVERGATLTRSLLAFSRQQPLSPQPLDARKVVLEIIDLIRRTTPESIDIRSIDDPGLWPCEADPGQLQNALLNLVSNARDAMPEGGRLTIETGNARLDESYAAVHGEVVAGDYVLLAVSDTGHGMSPEVAAQAFDPFFTTKPIGKGSGLGLSMVYGFAKQSRGHVKIYSEIGHGTTVKIYLPRSLAAEVPVPDRATGCDAGAGERILVVEDDPDMRALAGTLARRLGYAVLEAEGSEEALRVARASPPIALLLADVVLSGGMNGPQLALEVLRLHPAARVLYMSGYTENAILHQGRLDPGVHLLQKPFTKAELAAKLRQLLDS